MTRKRDTKLRAGRTAPRSAGKRQVAATPNLRAPRGDSCERLAMAFRAIRKEELGMSRRHACEATGFSDYALRRAESAATVGRMDYTRVIDLLVRYSACMRAHGKKLDMAMTILEPERTTRISFLTGEVSSVEPRTSRSWDLVASPPIR